MDDEITPAADVEHAVEVPPEAAVEAINNINDVQQQVAAKPASEVDEAWKKNIETQLGEIQATLASQAQTNSAQVSSASESENPPVTDVREVVVDPPPAVAESTTKKKHKSRFKSFRR